MPEAKPCCLCAQIDGRAGDDLIASLLPGRPYRRRVMLEDDAFAVVPSLGPLAPGHSLLCPKLHVRSFAELPERLDGALARMKALVRDRLAALYDAEVHVFEHGMSADGTRTVCSVDHAHLHLVPLPRGIGDAEPEGPWEPCPGPLLRTRAAGREYVYYETPAGSGRLRAGEPEIESQFMRKALARRLGRPERWDWRAEPEAAAADEAWRRFLA
jgi:ATP adenylyltransferase